MMFEVTYFIVEPEITDIRYFDTLEELSEWFLRQRMLEKTVIIAIQKVK